MKTAIATSDYYVPGETMINRHFEHLFKGETCIVTGRHNGENPFGKPVFERRAPLGFPQNVIAPFALVANRLVYGTSRPPFGKRKRELAAFLRAQQVEVILAEFGTQAIVLAPLAKEMGLPIFSYFRGTDASKSLRQRSVVSAYRRSISHLDGIISVSQFLLDNLSAIGVANANAHVIPSGVNTRLFTPSDKAPGSCLTVGRMVDKKAPLLTLRAFAQAAEGHPHARLTMIGGGPLQKPAGALARDLGLGDRVRFLGAQPHNVVREHLATHQIFLQHSVTAPDGNTEGLPTAIQEALACGCIVVSTRHAGIPEAIEDGVTGHLVEEHDEATYAARIADILADAGAGRMAIAARHTAELRYDNAMLLNRLQDVITNTVRERNVR